MEPCKRFRFSVLAVPLQKGVSVLQHSLTGKEGSGFGSWKTVPAVPVPLSVSGKTVPTVPVSGSGSVPEPPCKFVFLTLHQKPGKKLYASPFLAKRHFSEEGGGVYILSPHAAVIYTPPPPFSTAPALEG